MSDKSNVQRYIEREYSELFDNGANDAEALDGEYTRVNLSCLSKGLSSETLANIFCLSARKEDDGAERLAEGVAVLEELVKTGEIPLESDTFSLALEKWRKAGYPALHHSDAFRRTYHPAYRVVANRYARYIRLFAEIDGLLAQGSVTIAIEGGSASGKSTLADILSEVYSCRVFHMDDFFLRPEQRTADRFSEIGGNIDRERFCEEVLVPMKDGRTVSYRRFDCGTQTLGEWLTVEPKRLTVVEGVYSMHPSFGEYYDLSVFLDITPECQRNRILKRNTGWLAERFFSEWIPLENVYFESAGIKSRYDLIFAAE